MKVPFRRFSFSCLCVLTPFQLSPKSAKSDFFVTEDIRFHRSGGGN